MMFAGMLWLILLNGPIWAAQTGLADAISRGHEYLELIREVTEVPGLSAAVAVDGRIVWTDAVGLADLENEVPATPETLYRVGSVSKLLTVAVLARIAQSERIDLDASVRRYVPDLGEQFASITLRQLAGHLAGIRHYEEGEFYNRANYATATETLAIFKDDPLLHQPGTRYRYSSWGYALLSAAIEGALGKDFRTILKEEVLVPLDLRSTIPDVWGEIIPNRSRCYDTSDGKVVNSTALNLSDRWAGGGYLATAEDLVRFGAAHLGDAFLGQAIKREMFSSQVTSTGEETNVGLGWRIASDAWGRTYYHHAGSIAGGRAMLVVFPKSKVVVALTGNLGRAPFSGPEARTLAELFISTMVPSAPASWDPVGVWDMTRRTTDGPLRGRMRLSREEGKLTGTLLMGDGPEMKIAWAFVTGQHLSVSATDPRGQLEILWLTGDLDSLKGSSWRTRGDVEGVRRRPNSKPSP